MNTQAVDTFSWLGAAAMHLDAPVAVTCGRVGIGMYGGATSAGAKKNEDAALVWCAEDGAWEFAMAVDAHFSAESAALLLDVVTGDFDAITAILSGPLADFAEALRAHVVELFTSFGFRMRSREVVGEASCLLCARRDSYVWWFSVGDVVLHLYHPELARLGQYALNQRQFFEWIGARNTFELAVPCFTSGVRELAPGTNTLLLATDGLFEYADAPFADPARLYQFFTVGPDEAITDRVRAAVAEVHRGHGRDSATVIAWRAKGLGNWS